MPSFMDQLLHCRGLYALIVVALSLSPLQIRAQDFTKIPPGRLYQVATVSGHPILEDGDLGCAMTSDQLNSGNAGKTQYWEYTRPQFQIRPDYGQGCQYDVVSHGGMGGYPEGYTMYNWFGQGWVTIQPSCPVGYTYITQYPGGIAVSNCVRGAFVASKPCPTCDADRHVGNPISVGAGLKVEHATDAAFGDLTITRTFRSGLRWPVPVSMEFGLGWYSYISARIQYMPATSTTTEIAYALRPDGTVIPFLALGDGTWKADVDMATHVLAEIRDGSGAILGWSFVAADGSKETYNPKGVLMSLERHGITQMELRRNISGRLLAIVDRLGRAATVTYNTKGRIEKIVLPDGNEVVYAYDTQGRLTSVASANATKKYEYVDISGDSGVYLSKVRDETDTVFSQFGYDTSGRATSTQHAGSVDAFTLTYRNGGNDVDVEFPAGRIETYHFDLQRGSRMLRSGALTCTGCSIPMETRSYDVNGYPDLSTDRRGMATDRDFNAQGLEIQRIEAVNQADKRKIQTDWNSAFRVPTERRTYDAAGALVRKEMWTYNSRGQSLTHSVTDL